MKDSPYFNEARLLLRYLPTLTAGDHFALKGGTAINLFVRDMPRLSVDIDLAYLPLFARDDALVDARDGLMRMAAQAKRIIPGLQVRDAGNDENPKQIASVDGAQIKIEPNPVLCGTVFPVATLRTMSTVESLFELSVSVPVVSHADLYAGKLCAALDRQHPRDWFDVRQLLDHEGFGEQLRQAFVVYLASHDRPMAELLAPRAKPLREVFESEFAGMTRQPVGLEVLERTQQELPRLIRAQLNTRERQFLLSIKRGEPEWSLLPIEHLSELPALRWKLLNIEKLKAAPAKHREGVEGLKRVLEL